VTNKTAVNSIKATTVGTRYKDLADIVRSLTDTVRAAANSVVIPTIDTVLRKDSVARESLLFQGDSTRIKFTGNNSRNNFTLGAPGYQLYFGGFAPKNDLSDIGYGGTTNPFGVIRLGWDTLNYNNCIYLQPEANTSGVAKTIGLRNKTGSAMLTNDSGVLYTTRYLVDSNSRKRAGDTATALRTFMANNYWNNEFAQTLGHTGRLLAADSQAMVMGSENIVRDSMAANGSQRIMNFNSGAGISGTTYGLHIIDTNNVTGTSTRSALQVTSVLNAGGSFNFAFRASLSSGTTLINVPLTGQVFVNGGINCGAASTMVGLSTTLLTTSQSHVITSAVAFPALTVNKTGVGATDNAFRTQTAGVTDDTLSKGVFALRGICGFGSAPTIEDSTGTALATLTVSGTDMGGYITITLANPIAALRNVARVVFASASTTTARTVVALRPANDLAALNILFVPQSLITTTTYTIRSTAALSIGTYIYSYTVQKEK
jgi:hypothetical protein